MTNDGKKKPSWNDALEEDAEELGLSKSLLRTLAQMNPNLKGDKNTEELMSAVKATLKQGQGGAGAPKGETLAAAVAAQRAAFQKEMVACDEDLRKIEERRARLRAATLERVIEKCLQLDPELAQTASQHLLVTEKAFFDAVGFDAKKLAERRKKR